MIYLFVFTAMVTVLNIAYLISMFAKNAFNPPHYKELDPRSWWLFYPCLIYQIWFWTDKTGLF